MRPWNQRPFEVKNLFNPAFCAVLLARALESYETEQNVGMPFSLTHLVLPLTLHKKSREILASGNRTYFLKVVENNPQILIGFPQRAIYMRAFTQEGFGLLMQNDCIKIADDGSLALISGEVVKTMKGTPEIVECQKVSKYLGKQFARISDRVTVFSTLGVRP